MSRLRARTWTQRERAFMWAYWFRNGEWGCFSMLKMARRFSSCRRGLALMDGMRDIELGNAGERERIMRAKGYDLNSAYHRACADVETHVDPVSGLSCRELVELINELNGKRWKDAGIRRRARASRMRYSPHANRKYPMRRFPVWVRRDVDKVNDVWYDYQPWVPSDSNPNIYVHPAQPPERFTPSRIEIKPADAPEGTPWEVLA